MAENAPLQTVDRALTVLMSYGRDRQEWGVSELAAHFGWQPSGAHRLLSSLAQRGFLTVDPVTRRYRLGPAIWRLGALFEREGGLQALVAPVLLALARDTGKTVLFAVPDGFHTRVVAAVEGKSGPMRSSSLVGDLYPGHAGATSRAYFAFLTASERREFLRGHPVASFSPLTPTDPSVIDDLYVEAARLGYAYSEGEYDRSTVALAVPIMADRRPLGSLSLTERKEAQTGDLRDFLPKLRASAQRLARDLDVGRTKR